MSKDESDRDKEDGIADDTDDNLIHVDFSPKEDKSPGPDILEDYSEDSIVLRRNHVLVRYLEESRKSNDILTLSAFVSIALATTMFIILSILLILITMV